MANSVPPSPSTPHLYDVDWWVKWGTLLDTPAQNSRVDERPPQHAETLICKNNFHLPLVRMYVVRPVYDRPAYLADNLSFQVQKGFETGTILFCSVPFLLAHTVSTKTSSQAHLIKICSFIQRPVLHTTLRAQNIPGDPHFSSL